MSGTDDTDGGRRPGRLKRDTNYKNASAAVKQNTNRTYCPVVDTKTVAIKMDISKTEAFDRLKASPTVSGMPVGEEGETHVWW